MILTHFDFAVTFDDSNRIDVMLVPIILPLTCPKLEPGIFRREEDD